MITGAVKSKVDQIWTNIWAGGITNPLTVIEQLTYLMFIRSLDVKEIRNEKMGVLTGNEGASYISFLSGGTGYALEPF